MLMESESVGVLGEKKRVLDHLIATAIAILGTSQESLLRSMNVAPYPRPSYLLAAVGYLSVIVPCEILKSRHDE
jgi:hypothetical protein